MKWLSRLAVILKTVYRFGLADLLAARGKTPWFVKLLPRSGNSSGEYSAARALITISHALATVGQECPHSFTASA